MVGLKANRQIILGVYRRQSCRDAVNLVIDTVIVSIFTGLNKL